MNYTKLYSNIIENAKNRKINTYCEKHHIKPKCIGGSNDKSNIVSLTAREHYICHKLLYKIYPNNKKLLYAWCCMAFAKNSKQERVGISSREFQRLRVLFSESIQGKNHPMYGKKHSDEVKKKIARFSKTNPNYGNSWSDEQKRKNSNTTTEWLNKNKHPRKGIKLTDSTIEKMKKTKMENPQFFSDETRKRMSDKSRGELNGNSKFVYKFISPVGVVYKKIYSIKDFAREHDLSEGGIRNALKKGIKTKGWFVEVGVI